MKTVFRMPDAPWHNPRPRVVQWLCGLIVHKDINFADGMIHGAYCKRCHKIFGHPWGNKTKFIYDDPTVRPPSREMGDASDPRNVVPGS